MPANPIIILVGISNTKQPDIIIKIYMLNPIKIVLVNPIIIMMYVTNRIYQRILL